MAGLRRLAAERRAEAIFQRRAPRLSPARRRRLALTAVEAARALVQYIETGVPAAERRAMRRELRAMLVAYLAPWLGDDRGSDGVEAADDAGPAGVA